ncbi:MAG: sensor histidine kinase, partial [Cyclobacteriaceae bacterium]
RIQLSKELKYIKNYIELEEIRYGDRFVCNLSIHGNTEVLIPPLLMLPFIENSFKHGIKHESDKGWVNINVSVAEKKFVFKIENSIGEISTQNKGQNGLGIANVKRRLELLYPESHELSYSKSEKQFKVNLEIDL